MTEGPLHTVVPWREVAAGFPAVLRAMPNDSLGGVLDLKKNEVEGMVDTWRREIRPVHSRAPRASGTYHRAARLYPGVVV